MSRRAIHLNPGAAHARCDPAATNDSVRAFHQSLPGYAPTPLTALPDVARELGVRAVYVKDESNRFGLPSFKALGASWGCYRAVAAQLGVPAHTTPAAMEALAAQAQTAGIVLFAATEGNHGRAVAFMARLLGVPARIFVPGGMDEPTRGRIAGEGAEVVVSTGNYDQAVDEAAAAAGETPRGVLVQDTAFAGYEEVPAWIVEGYTTMLAEVEEQLQGASLRAGVMITPVGVGSLAHAVARFCKARDVAVVAVEPDSAPCLYESMRADRPVSVSTSATIMDGMNCGTVSSTAWPDLRRFVDACVTVSSAESHAAVQDLATRSVHAGPCGGASLAALRRIARESSGLLRDDSVLVLLSTEGARPYAVPRDVAVEDVVGLTQALTRIDSSSPSLSLSDGAGESEIAEYIAAWFAHRDIEHHRVETVPGRPSIVGVLRGSGGGQSLMFNGHTDTVSLSSYEGDALSGALAERNGRPVVLGRGSIDMKGGLAAALAALASIKASGKTLRGDVIVAAVSDEEDASQGTRDVIAAGWRADAAVVAEPTMGEIITAHRGFVWVEVDILGVAAHGSAPEQGHDAILSAGWFLRALEEYQTRLPVDEMLGQASLHCGLIQGGEEPSSYPAKCTVTVEFRTVPIQTEETILADLKALLKSVVVQKPDFRYAEPRITMSRPTHKLAADHPLVQAAAAAASAVLGYRPAVVSVPFWCDASLLGEAGIPSIVYGPKGEGLHSKEEFVEVESLKEQTGIFEQMIREMCK
ncbi:tryptophan synthase beta subunit-like PLP-dependent enzyme [Aspergillus ambiguus]|uniref:tryptophan synthase beta subunit-like PLP-dependent enzyme n=1 Tax=Aspergillus ambiguus TaxID=176160 RepID=UPI003CCCD9D3